MRSSLVWMRSSPVVRASDCQCRSRNSTGFDPSFLRQSGIWGAADGAVLNTVHRKNKSKKIPLLTDKVEDPVIRLLHWWPRRYTVCPCLKLITVCLACIDRPSTCPTPRRPSIQTEPFTDQLGIRGSSVENLPRFKTSTKLDSSLVSTGSLHCP